MRRFPLVAGFALVSALSGTGCGSGGGGGGGGPHPSDGGLPDVPTVLDLTPLADALCVPADEICNGIDDDCDGLVDDDDPDVARAVFSDERNCGSCGHTCQAVHATRTVCQAGGCQVSACESGYSDYNGQFDDGCESDCRVSAGGREICDHSDNDCDGQIDEDFDLTADKENCGDCGVVCDPRPNASVACKASTCVLDQCAAGYVDVDGNQENGCEYACTPRSTDQIKEFCNGLDDDCDGLIDELDDLAPPEEDFCGQNGVCAYECGEDAECGEPTSRCSDTHICVPIAGVPENLACETDADCQAVHRGLACIGHVTLGADGPITVRTCAERRHEPMCDARAGYRCVRPPEYRAGTEVGLCDGVDNNCDGRVDEDYVNALFVDGARRQEPRTCTAGQGSCAQGGHIQCTADGTSTECSAQALPPARPVDDDCNGVDDNCDGRIDEDFRDAYVQVGGVLVYAYEASRPGATSRVPGLDLLPDDGLAAYIEARSCSKPSVLPWSDVTWAEAQAACAASGARLCRRDEWTLACGGANDDAYPYGNNYQPETCNGGGRDGDPATAGDQDVVIAAGSLAACQRGGVFDLSGNLKEWTDDLTDGLRPVRGGGLESNVPESLTCGAVSDLKPEAFRSSTLGFRCCKDP